MKCTINRVCELDQIITNAILVTKDPSSDTYMYVGHVKDIIELRPVAGSSLSDVDIEIELDSKYANIEPYSLKFDAFLHTRFISPKDKETVRSGYLNALYVNIVESE